MPPSRLSVLFLMGFMTTLTSEEASAYVTARVSEGSDIELRWPDDDEPLVWTVGYRGAPGVWFPLLHDAIADSFGAWDAVEGADVAFAEAPAWTEEEIVVDGLTSLWWVEEGWEVDSLVIALTAVSYQEDGTIVDADIAFNAESFDFSVSPPDVGIERDIDLQSVATHEIGHLLGLSHTEVEGATMLADYSPGDREPRTLEEDDEEGVRHLYPCETEECQEGCQTVPGSHPWDGGVIALVGAMMGMGARRMRRGGGRRWRGGVGMLVGMALLMNSGRGWGSSVEKVPLVELAALSELVLRGRVLAVEPVCPEEGLPRTRAWIQVSQVFAGEAGKVVMVVGLGGRCHGITTRVMGAPLFLPGEDLLLFLSRDSSGALTPLGLWQGRFQVDAASLLAWRPEDSTEASPRFLEEVLGEAFPFMPILEVP